jgi:hypothetical protein
LMTKGGVNLKGIKMMKVNKFKRESK